MIEKNIDNRLPEFGGKKLDIPDFVSSLKPKFRFSFPKFLPDWPEDAPAKINRTVGGDFE